MYRIGYLYQQFYSITQEDGSARTGYTNHAVLHKLNDAGDIVRTYDYKCTRDFAETAVVGDSGRPLFDGFSRLADLVG